VRERSLAAVARHAKPSAASLRAANLLVIYLGLLLLVPARLVAPGMGAAGRPAAIAGLALLVWWALSRLHPNLATRGPQPVRWILLAFTIAVLVSYVLGLDRGLVPLEVRSADRFLLSMGSWLGVALVAADGLRDRRDVMRVIRALVALCACSALIGLLQYYGLDLAPQIQLPGLVYNGELVGVGQRGGPGLSRVYGTQQHYIEFSVILAMGWPFAMHSALSAGSRLTARLSWLAVVVITAAIPLAISRAGSLGLIAGFAILSVAWPRPLRVRALFIALIGLVAFRSVIPGVLGTIRSAFLSYENDPSIVNRLADYAATQSYIEDRPWFGRGPGTFIPELYRLLDSQYLGSRLELGYIGIVALGGVFLGAYLLGRSVRKRADFDTTAHLGQALAASAAVALVASFTFDSLSFPTFAGMLFLNVGLAGAVWRLRHEDFREPPNLRHFCQPAWRMPTPAFAETAAAGGAQFHAGEARR
jgi:O-antigen ligase